MYEEQISSSRDCESHHRKNSDIQVSEIPASGLNTIPASSFSFPSPTWEKKINKYIEIKKHKKTTVNTWSAHQVTRQPRSGRSGVYVPSRADKGGRCGRGLAFPPPMGRCAAVRCGRHACATTRLPVLGNTGSPVQVRLLSCSAAWFRFVFLGIGRDFTVLEWISWLV